jgi:hypothetical protein
MEYLTGLDRVSGSSLDVLGVQVGVVESSATVYPPCWEAFLICVSSEVTTWCIVSRRDSMVAILMMASALFLLILVTCLVPLLAISTAAASSRKGRGSNHGLGM